MKNFRFTHYIIFKKNCVVKNKRLKKNERECGQMGRKFEMLSNARNTPLSLPLQFQMVEMNEQLRNI